ncbi:type II toxin-antitoxin system death-on-curing family toxin [Alteribacillus sp. JSM 102045]|uniref:type II toxin-antitoxin system death-on-curing family toxin n=1 Tax=Alteribacillus sp. JSM 102045 TaxID=1562101 RepID=UPI0035C1A3BF
MDVTYLTGEEIEVIHYTLMELYEDSDQAGIKSHEKFELMLDRPKTYYFGTEQFPTLLEKACCYFHSIVRGHIFHNGNKRTGLTVLETFLNINGFELTMEEGTAEDFTVYAAKDERFKENDCIHYLVAELEDFIKPIW